MGVEGMCTQTEAVLSQAWREGVQPCLILNKMDRLITELKFSPLEAYQHIIMLLEQINAFTSTFITAEAMEKAARMSSSSDDFHHGKKKTKAAKVNQNNRYNVDIDEERQLVFSPELGNVVFCSAIDGWAFRISQFSELWATKLKLKKKCFENFSGVISIIIPKQKR